MKPQQQDQGASAAQQSSGMPTGSGMPSSNLSNYSPYDMFIDPNKSQGGSGVGAMGHYGSQIPASQAQSAGYQQIDLMSYGSSQSNYGATMQQNSYPQMVAGQPINAQGNQNQQQVSSGYTYSGSSNGSLSGSGNVNQTMSTHPYDVNVQILHNQAGQPPIQNQSGLKQPPQMQQSHPLVQQQQHNQSPNMQGQQQQTPLLIPPTQASPGGYPPMHLPQYQQNTGPQNNTNSQGINYQYGGQPTNQAMAPNVSSTSDPQNIAGSNNNNADPNEQVQVPRSYGNLLTHEERQVNSYKIIAYHRPMLTQKENEKLYSVENQYHLSIFANVFVMFHLIRAVGKIKSGAVKGPMLNMLRARFLILPPLSMYALHTTGIRMQNQYKDLAMKYTQHLTDDEIINFDQLYQQLLQQRETQFREQNAAMAAQSPQVNYYQMQQQQLQTQQQQQQIQQHEQKDEIK